MIGTNLNFTVGILNYQAATAALNLAGIISAIVIPVVLVVFICLLLIFIIVCVSASKVQEKDKHLNTLLRMERQGIETADDYISGATGKLQRLSEILQDFYGTGVALAIKRRIISSVSPECTLVSY